MKVFISAAFVVICFCATWEPNVSQSSLTVRASEMSVKICVQLRLLFSPFLFLINELWCWDELERLVSSVGSQRWFPPFATLLLKELCGEEGLLNECCLFSLKAYEILFWKLPGVMKQTATNVWRLPCRAHLKQISLDFSLALGRPDCSY